MPPKAFKPPRPTKSGVFNPTKAKSTTSRKSTGTGTASKPNGVTKHKAQCTSQDKDKSKDKTTPKRPNSIFKVPHLSGLPSISPDSSPSSSKADEEGKEDEDDPFATQKSANPSQKSHSPIEIDSKDSGEQEEEEGRERIPADLLTRLLHENFKEDGTRLSKDAGRAVGKYMETFVREALARAAFARGEIEERGEGGGGGFLEVEDLERMAPQLLLDF